MGGETRSVPRTSTIPRRQYSMTCLVIYGQNKHSEIVGWKERCNYSCGHNRPDKTSHEVFEVIVSGAVVRYIKDEDNVDPSRCSPAVLPVQPIKRFRYKSTMGRTLDFISGVQSVFIAGFHFLRYLESLPLGFRVGNYLHFP